jgi:hypothetical protein
MEGHVKATMPKHMGMKRNRKIPPGMLYLIKTKRDFKSIPFHRKKQIV